MLFKYKFLMSANRHLAPGVNTTLLKTHFSVVTDAVGALRFPVKSNKFPSTVNLVRSLSFFGFHHADYFAIGYLFVFGDFGFGNEHDRICPLDLYDTLS